MFTKAETNALSDSLEKVTANMSNPSKQKRIPPTGKSG